VGIAGIAILFIWLIVMALAVASFGFWIWMLIDCISNEPSEGNDKLIWILVIVFTHFIGAAVYYFVRRPERIDNFGQ
jgi:Na+-transporting methylmalonyl-CoA/oxaloacetate decarboxylase gamma subunit